MGIVMGSTNHVCCGCGCWTTGPTGRAMVLCPECKKRRDKLAREEYQQRIWDEIRDARVGGQA